MVGAPCEGVAEPRAPAELVGAALTAIGSPIRARIDDGPTLRRIIEPLRAGLGRVRRLRIRLVRRRRRLLVRRRRIRLIGLLSVLLWRIVLHRQAWRALAAGADVRAGRVQPRSSSASRQACR